jgi:hypothetical protein
MQYEERRVEVVGLLGFTTTLDSHGWTALIWNMQYEELKKI